MIVGEVNQLHGRRQPMAFWQGWLNRTSRVLRLRRHCQVSIALVDGRTIRRLNRIYRGRDEVTDVLSFREADGPRFAAGGRAGELLGEVVICYPQAQRQARQLGHALRTELAVLLVHSCLHLLGYEHDRRPAADRMAKLEQRILGQRLPLA